MSEKTRTICLWGESGSTKTSQAYQRIKRMYQRTGKICRAVYADNGGAAALIDSGLVEEGIVDLWDISDRQDSAMSTGIMIAEGYWYLPTKSGLKTVRPEPIFKTSRQDLEKKIGMYLFEGGTSYSMLIARGFANATDKKAFGRSFKYDEGGYSFGGISEYHIGMIQNHLLDMLQKSKANLPVDEIIWTFHDGAGQDRNKQVNQLVPEILGKAMNGKVGKEFWDMIHLCKELVKLKDDNELEVTETRVIAYFEDHPDSVTNIPCKAKVRILPELYPYLKQKWPNGGVVLNYQNGINELYDAIDKLKVKAKEVGLSWIEEAKRDHAKKGISSMQVTIPNSENRATEETKDTIREPKDERSSEGTVPNPKKEATFDWGL